MKITVGYLKDFLAASFFAFMIILHLFNIQFELNNMFIYFVFIAFFADGIFTLFPKFHCEYVGFNIPTYIVFIASLLVLITMYYCKCFII